jgi:hypothetical protein
VYLGVLGVIKSKWLYIHSTRIPQRTKDRQKRQVSATETGTQKAMPARSSGCCKLNSRPHLYRNKQNFYKLENASGIEFLGIFQAHGKGVVCWVNPLVLLFFGLAIQS